MFLNYLIRENSGISGICDTLKTASEYYRFSQVEKDTALMLFRCLKPLWFTRIDELKDAKSDYDAIKASLDESEHELTNRINFGKYMG